MLTGTFRLVLVVSILGLASLSGNAAESRLQPFMMTGGKTSQPIGHYEFCLTHRSECVVKSRSEERIRLTVERWNELVAVNNMVNTKISPATDEDLYGRAEFWTYPTS